jgi:phage baseplate assembly protein V
MHPNEIKQLIGRALTGVRSALRGKLVRANAAKRVLLVQSEGAAGEQFNAIEAFQQPGLRSVPLPGMQTVVIPLNGRSAHGVVVAMSNGALYVTDLQPGEVALFNENDGAANSLVLRNGKIAELTTGTYNIKATVGVNFDTPKVTMNHLLEVAENTQTGTLTVVSTAADAAQIAGGMVAAGDVSGNGKSLSGHTHKTNAIGVQTDPPA